MVPAATHIDTPLGSKETPPRRDAESQNRCSVVGFTRHVNFAGPCIDRLNAGPNVLYQHVRTDLTLIHTACEPDTTKLSVVCVASGSLGPDLQNTLRQSSETVFTN